MNSFFVAIEFPLTYEKNIRVKLMAEIASDISKSPKPLILVPMR